MRAYKWTDGRHVCTRTVWFNLKVVRSTHAPALLQELVVSASKNSHRSGGTGFCDTEDEILDDQ